MNLVYQGGPEREVGLELLEMIRERVLNERFSMTLLPIANICTARYEVERGNLDGVIEFCRRAVGEVFHSGAAAWSAPTVAVLVESLLRRGSDADLREARAAIDRLATLPTDPGYVIYEIWLLCLETLLAQAHGDEAAYRQHRDRYRARAISLGFEGHMHWVEALP